MTESTVVVEAPAKVNLHLRVGSLRADGYHELETIFQALSLTDRLTLKPAKNFSIVVSGPFANQVPTDHRNLVFQAAQLVMQNIGHGLDLQPPPVAVHIEKTIPVAGGMAGGSADAAAALVGFNEYFELGWNQQDLARQAIRLGSDVPFALQGGTALGTGRGEVLTPMLTSRESLHWVLAVAQQGLQTSKVYQELDRLRTEHKTNPIGDIRPIAQALAAGDLTAIAALLSNDLQAAALSLYPELRRTLRLGMMAGAIGGVVSGSGPTCAFLCQAHQQAIAVAAELAGSGVARSTRVATGPVSGAHLVHR